MAFNVSSRGGYSVSWSSHGSAMCGGLQELQQRAEFVDLTLAADGHLVRAHQLVVGLASPYLKALIRSAATPHPVVFLNNVSHGTLCCLLQYMYTGEVVVPADQLKLFITTGKALHVKGLDEMMFQETISTKSKKRASPDVMEAASTLENISSGHAGQPVSHVIVIPEQSKVSIDKYDSVTIPEPFSQTTPAKRPKTLSTQTIVKDMPDVSSENQMDNEMYYEDTEIIEENALSDDNYIQDDMQGDAGQDIEEESCEVRSTFDKDPQKAEVMYTMSNMGGLQLILNRYMYRMRNKYKDGRRRWQCVNYNLTKCNAMAVTQDNAILSRQALHNHPYHDKKIMFKVKNNLVFGSINNMPATAKGSKRGSAIAHSP